MELQYKEKKYKIIGIKPNQDKYDYRIYVTDGKWAFDYAGWTPEEELLNETKRRRHNSLTTQ